MQSYSLSFRIIFVFGGVVGVETKVLNQAVKRNIERYPEDVLFQLDRKDVFFLKSQQVSANEYNADLRSQFVTLKGSTTGSDTEEINY